MFIYFSFVLEVQAVPSQYASAIHCKYMAWDKLWVIEVIKVFVMVIRFVCSGLRKMNRNRKEASFKSVINARFKHLYTFSISIARGCGTVSFVITGLLLGYYLAHESNTVQTAPEKFLTNGG